MLKEIREKSVAIWREREEIEGGSSKPAAGGADEQDGNEILPEV